MKKTFSLKNLLFLVTFLGCALPQVKACDTPLATFSARADTLVYMWNSVSGAMGYEYLIDNSPMPPMSGNSTMMTSGTMVGLQAGQTYYLHVRTICMSGMSTWYNSPAITKVTSPSNVIAIPTATSASFSWPVVSGATGYEYLVNATAASPSAGQSITANSVNATTLNSSTTYYFHLRTKSSNNSFSSWVNQPFTTLAPTAVANVSIQGESSISVYPNPVTSTLYVDVANPASNASAQIWDINGRLVKDVKINVPTDISEMPNGLYLIRYTDDTRSEVLKVTKQ